ncbi:hypothetical protein J6590_052587 [Homalodisca vitripennis]|nr:hypothetical protein J6590_052587 [Homalodisca vitripennis]
MPLAISAGLLCCGVTARLWGKQRNNPRDVHLMNCVQFVGLSQHLLVHLADTLASTSAPSAPSTLRYPHTSGSFFYVGTPYVVSPSPGDVRSQLRSRRRNSPYNFSVFIDRASYVHHRFCLQPVVSINSIDTLSVTLGHDRGQALPMVSEQCSQPVEADGRIAHCYGNNGDACRDPRIGIGDVRSRLALGFVTLFVSLGFAPRGNGLDCRFVIALRVGGRGHVIDCVSPDRQTRVACTRLSHPPARLYTWGNCPLSAQVKLTSFGWPNRPARRTWK